MSEFCKNTEVLDKNSDVLDASSLIRKVTFGADNLPGFEVGILTNPAIVLVQEWWGVTEIIKQQAQLISNRGYRVLIPDLYKGVIGIDREEASHLLTSLDYHLAVSEINQAVNYLINTGSPKVGITGGCMGGALAFAAAQHVPKLSAAAPLYGTPAREMPWIEVNKINIPISYHTGKLDKIYGFSDPRTAVIIYEHMKTAGCNIELYLYDDTPHSFLNALTTDGIAFNEKWEYGIPPQEQ
eukprot:gene9585-19922_t